MLELGSCSFKEFINSGFCNDFITTDKDGNEVLETPGAKIVFSVEIDDEDMFGDNYLHYFYKKGPQRWVKKLEASDQQLIDDCTVVLMGSKKDQSPESILFDFYYNSFEYPLTNEMIDAVKEAVEYKITDYFPGYTDGGNKVINEFLDPAMTPDMSYFDAPGHFGYGFSFKNPEKSKSYKAVLRLLKNGPMKKGDILNAMNACGALPYRNIDWNKDPGKRGECSSMFIAMHKAGLVSYDRKTHLWSLGPKAEYYMARYGILNDK